MPIMIAVALGRFAKTEKNLKSIDANTLKKNGIEVTWYGQFLCRQ